MPTYNEDNQPCAIDGDINVDYCITHGQDIETCRSEIKQTIALDSDCYYCGESCTDDPEGDYVRVGITGIAHMDCANSRDPIGFEKCPYCGRTRAIGGVCNAGC